MTALIGAWGEQASELLELHARRGQLSHERWGALVVAGSEQATDAERATDGDWRCWMSGQLLDARGQRERFGLPPDASGAQVAARAYARLGAEAIERLRGVFVIVALDRQRERALVARDQLGGRPLVYARLHGGVVFAEHERDILELLPSTPEPNRLALARWADGGTLPPGRSLYAGIHRLPPGHRLHLTRHALTVEPYWRPRFEGTTHGAREELAECLRNEAFAAVDRAGAGSRRLAVSLSGGLDSACIAAGVAARGGAEQALALSNVFPDHPEIDERALIEATAEHTGLALHEFAFDPRASILAPAIEHIARWRLPPATPNLFVWGPTMSGARELGVDTMLDGEGGDELFGPAPFLIADMLRRGRLAAAWSLTRRIPEMGADVGTRIRLRALRLFGVRPLVPASLQHRRARARIERAAGSSLLAPADALAILDIDAQARGRLDGPLWWRTLAQDLVYGNEILDASAHMRRESLSTGIDRRHPFLHDLELVRAVLRQPPDLQFDPLRDRALLRDALVGHIPEAVRTRHAKSFFTPLLAHGLASDGKILTRELARRDAPIRGYVRGQALDRLLEQCAGGGASQETRRSPVPGAPLSQAPGARLSRAPGAPLSHAQARKLWYVGVANAWLRAGERPRHVQELRERLSSR